MKRRQLLTTALLASLALLLSATASHAQLEWRISVKFILGAGGQRPAGGGGFGASSFALTNNQTVIDNINYANQLLDRNCRGYRFRLTEIQNAHSPTGAYSGANPRGRSQEKSR